MKSGKRIYLDYAASTPVDPAVLKAMMPYFSDEFGNPGSIHSFGQAAQNAVDEARETIAKAIGADFREVIFTGSATEANNLALRGTVKAARRHSKQAVPPNQDIFLKPKIIVSAIEHESVLDTARDLKNDGVEVVFIPVDRDGIIDVGKIEEALDERTVLVSVMYVNNEIGSVQPIAQISEIIRNFRNNKTQIINDKSMPKARISKTGLSPSRPFGISHLDFEIAGASYPLLHTDAVQAFNWFDCDVRKLGVDFMTLSGQKIYGPKGIGALYARNPKLLLPIVTGGGQEFNLRSGTENVPAIVGFGKAVESASKERTKNSKAVAAFKDRFWRGLKNFYPEAEMNGESGAPHILNIYFPTEYAGDLLIKLDLAGVTVSAGSACSARSFMPSYVLQALGLPGQGLSQERVRGSLRFSFGKMVTKEEISEVLRRMKGILNA